MKRPVAFTPLLTGLELFATSRVQYSWAPAWCRATRWNGTWCDGGDRIRYELEDPRGNDLATLPFSGFRKRPGEMVADSHAAASSPMAWARTGACHAVQASLHDLWRRCAFWLILMAAT